MFNSFHLQSHLPPIQVLNYTINELNTANTSKQSGTASLKPAVPYRQHVLVAAYSGLYKMARNVHKPYSQKS